MLTKVFKTEFKFSSDVDIYQVEAYASTFGNIDTGRDIVESGSFTKTLKENVKRIKALFNHDWNQVVGKPIEIQEDSKGLYTKTQFVKTAKSQEIYELVKENIVNELSIGYDIVKSNYDKVNKANHLRELKLYEYSFVTFAMNEYAQVTQVKFDNIIKELKSGRVLSDKNVNNIKQVIEALNALLAEGTNPEPSLLGDLSPDTMGCSGDKPKKSHELDYDILLQEIKKLALK
jgi:HK97 family phage prohead protease